MKNDLMDIFETESSEVEQAIRSLEEAAFPPEPEEEQTEIIEETAAEEVPEPAAEVSEAEPEEADCLLYTSPSPRD